MHPGLELATLTPRTVNPADRVPTAKRDDGRDACKCEQCVGNATLSWARAT
jgi:hypothetical protein